MTVDQEPTRASAPENREEGADRGTHELLAVFAHELRTPLAPLRVGLDSLRMAPADFDREAVLRMMGDQLEYLTRLIDDLLDLERVNLTKLHLVIERITLGSIFRRAVEVTRPTMISAHHRLTVELPDADIWLDGDCVRLTQVLANLLLNSARYTHDAGEISLRASRVGNEVVISIADNGIGIEPVRLSSIFDLFGQAAHSSQHGLGIGLALVKGLVELHHGSVAAFSAGLGAGSRFVVRLPCQDPL